MALDHMPGIAHAERYDLQQLEAIQDLLRQHVSDDTMRTAIHNLCTVVCCLALELTDVHLQLQHLLVASHEETL